MAAPRVTTTGFWPPMARASMATTFQSVTSSARADTMPARAVNAQTVKVSSQVRAAEAICPWKTSEGVLFPSRDHQLNLPIVSGDCASRSHERPCRPQPVTPSDGKSERQTRKFHEESQDKP